MSDLHCIFNPHEGDGGHDLYAILLELNQSKSMVL
jgi:hypothetical protein